MKICDDTKNSVLCSLRSMVTNSTLTFSDIAFLQINQEIAAILKLSEIGQRGLEEDVGRFVRRCQAILQ